MGSNTHTSKKTYKNGYIYDEDGVCRGRAGSTGYVYPNQELVKKYWPLAVMIGLVVIILMI